MTWRLRIGIPAGSLLALVLWLSANSARGEPTPQATFTLVERFGVSHPDQLVDFDLDAPAHQAPFCLLGPDGAEAPYQLLDGGARLAVRTDLPAGAEKRWTLVRGRAPAPVTNGVTVATTERGYEIANGLTGVRVPLPTAALQPTPAPVQGVRGRDGHWMATGSGTLSIAARSMDVQFVERGPLKTIVQVSYRFDRPEQRDGDRVVAPAGQAFYTSTIEVQAGQPSVLFEEESDIDVSYSLELHAGLEPTQARYRGHFANSPAFGREPDGTQYRWKNSPKDKTDATVDLSYDTPRSYRRLAIWDLWIYNGGWYWQLYNEAAPPGANLVGLFAGRSSRALRAGPGSGVNLYTTPLGVTDLTTQLDGNGNLHVAFLNGGACRYVRFDSQQKPGVPVSVADGWLHPDLLVREDGRVAIAGYDAALRSVVRAEQGPDGAFVAAPVPLDTPDLLTITQPFVYQAESGGTDFLLVYGVREGHQGAILYARKPGELVFSFRDSLADALCGRQGERPVFARLGDGRLALLYSRVDACLAFIQPGEVTFDRAQEQVIRDSLTGGKVYNFGSAIDPGAGVLFLADPHGVLTLVQPDGQAISTSTGAPTDHQGLGPNRRTVAMDPTGQALAVHNGRLYRFQAGAWTEWTAARTLELQSPRVHFHPASKQFLLVGRRNGRLSIYGWTPAETAPRWIHEWPETDRRAAGFTITLARGPREATAASAAASPLPVRFAWGWFSGVKGEDLKPPAEIQPIARQMNLHAGIHLNKVHRLSPDYPDPPAGYGALFMDRAALDRVIRRVREDKDFFAHLYGYTPRDRPLLDLWTDTDGRRVKEAADAILDTARELLDAWVNGDGIYSIRASYINGGGTMMDKGPWIDQVLAHPALTPDDRNRIKAAAALFANVLWDEDYVPLDGHAGVNLGNANMSVSQVGARRFYALLLAGHPEMKARAEAVTQATLATVHTIINEHGAAFGSVHYTYPSAMPTLNTLLQIRMLGQVDPFATEPRLARFAEFYMNFLTPPEVRFGGDRKVVAIGDSATEANALVGPLATGFRTAHSALSARLQGAWVQSGRPYAAAFGTDLLRIDGEAPAADPDLGNATFPGWYSVLRHGWGTPDETVVWMVNGDFYADHRHSDQGSIAAYALGAPLSLDWGPIYYPQVTMEYMHSMIMPEGVLRHAWDADRLGLASRTNEAAAQPPRGVQYEEWLKAFLTRGYHAWTDSTQEQFLSLAESARAVGRFRLQSSPDTTWRRTLTTLHGNPAYPVILIQDTFEGDRAGDSKIFTLNLVAEGGVDTPAGRITPVPRLNDPPGLTVVPQADQLPSAGPVFALSAGLNRLAFTGQSWPKHPTQGIDWDLYLAANEPQQAFIGHWGNRWTDGQGQSQFKAANGRPYEERQHILRVRGNRSFTALLLPHRKGEPPKDLQVDREGGTLRVHAGGETTVVGPDFYRQEGTHRQALAAFSAAPVEGGGLSIRGGAAEVVVAGPRATITVHGEKGTRQVRLPGSWRAAKGTAPVAGVTLQKEGATLEYAGGEPVRVELEMESP